MSKIKGLCCAPSIFLSLWACITSAHADVNTSGFQINAYIGTTITRVNPGTINLVSETDSLTPNAQNYADLASGFGAAYRFVLPAVTTNQPYLLHDITLGLDYYSPTQITQYGDVSQYQVPDYSNYNYRLSIQSERLMLDGEWAFYPIKEQLFPFIETGIGIAHNTASYSDSPNTPDYAPGLSINQHTQNQFAYTLGAGLKWAFTRTLSTSLRYLYTDLGNASTASTGSLPMATPLNVELSSQTLLLGLTYMF